MASPPTKMAKLDHAPPRVTGHPQPRAPAPAALSPTPSSSTSSRRIGLASGVDRTKVRSIQLGPSKAKLALGSKPQPAAQAADPLATLARAARAILARPPLPTPESLQALYSLTEHVVHKGNDAAQQLYDRLRLELERAAGDLRRSLAAPVPDSAASTTTASSASGVKAAAHEAWTKQFDDEVGRFGDQVLLVRSVFLHLDRTYVLQSPALLSIWDLGLSLFQHSVLTDATISSRITSATLDLVALERSGTSVPHAALRAFFRRVRSFATPAAYDELVLAPFLDATAAHYAAQGDAQALELDSATYLARVVEALGNEDERVKSVFGGAGEAGLAREVERRVEDGLIKVHVEDIATKDTAKLCEEDLKDELATLYGLLKRVDRLGVLRTAFLAYLKTAALALVSDPAQDAHMVERLIALRHRARALVVGPFERNEDEFGKAVNSAFESVVNTRQNKPAEMMAKYLDAKLRSGGARGLDDVALEAVLNDVLYLFRFTQGKDIFEAFYKRDLAKRLLLHKSASFDAERSMLLKLKDECGPGFTQKLEIMFKDMDLSADVMRAFSASSSSSGSAFDLSVSVLSQGNWPTYPPFPIALPPALTAAKERFRAFYVAKHSGRALSWASGLDTVTLRAHFPTAAAASDSGKAGTARKELLVSLAQAVVLLLFNDPAEQGAADDGTLSVEEIGAATQLESKELARTLQSLACGKVRVLTKQPKGRDVNPGDRFAFNSEFKSDHVRIKINQIQQKETVEENKSTTERVFTDRASHLQLAIVRIMKARKTLKHQELVMEVVSQIGQRFKVEPAEIKKSIASLIDREYMGRAEDNHALYHYIA